MVCGVRGSDILGRIGHCTHQPFRDGLGKLVTLRNDISGGVSSIVDGLGCKLDYVQRPAAGRKDRAARTISNMPARNPVPDRLCVLQRPAVDLKNSIIKPIVITKQGGGEDIDILRMREMRP